jgi:hypothetical protein
MRWAQGSQTQKSLLLLPLLSAPLSSADVYTLTAQEKGGARAARDIEELVSEVTGLFAGGQLSEDALEGAMRALNDAYWQAKEKNKKYTPKKYRHADQ